MFHLLSDLSTDALLRVVSTLEARLIRGVARAEDTELYMLAQLEIAERTYGPVHAPQHEEHLGGAPATRDPSD